MRDPLRLRRVAASGLPGRAYPLEVRHTKGGPEGGEQSWLGGIVDIHWRVEPGGRAPYEFLDRLDAPGWIYASHRGKKAWNVRYRPSHGIQADLGVPCRVDPDDPEFIAVDWEAGYEEHTKAWDELDARMRHVSRRRGGLDGLLDKVTLKGARELDSSDAEQLDLVMDEQERQDAAAEAAAQVPSEAVMGLMVEREGIQAQMDEIKRLKKKGRKVPATIVSCETTGTEVSGLPVWLVRAELREPDASPRTVEQQLAMAKLSGRRLKAGKQVTARVDPADPSRVSLI